MTTEPNEDQIRKLVAQIVTSYVSGNEIAPEALPALIRSIYTTLSEVNQPAVVPVEKPTPAVSPRKSVFPDYIVCLEDGKKLKLLRRHLKTAYNMTPQQYRERWDLPAEYPMVAPNYANHRSSLARKIGLGTRREG
ncbi:MucR family transcriptional regulator [Tanticharoenia sakaeratensis]|jgi:predicted transcriptional regulator|uniref:Transcriptional regulator n=1 Tax=Tanticharoenia sakaeratensis NBRC 103193 TaxID=1231623 RepID=A0A0D6MH37_9PROT|nr:MucR family transcriptional regulator [Tanticharoenia sakaeratensis]GAN52811.1 transcriptional regulator [Tanticharoenia sakaeratensis NBRC 103193]GBQ18087.1 Ros/MucR family transcriptional regulator [Tanticharoenia sakaeratensis NBRC 103193]